MSSANRYTDYDVFCVANSHKKPSKLNIKQEKN